MMNEQHRRFLWAQIGVAAAFNLPLNGGVAWLMFRHAPPLPMWAKGPSVGSDTIGTSFFLPLITCLILTKVVRSLVQKGKAPKLDWTRAERPLLGRLPSGTLARGAAIGLLSAVLIAPATIFALQAIGLSTMTGFQVVVFKGIYSALLAALVTVPIVLWALNPPVQPGSATA